VKRRRTLPVAASRTSPAICARAAPAPKLPQ